MNGMNVPNKEKKKNYRVQGIAVGMALGVIFGISQDNVGLGIALGLCLGVAYGEARERKEIAKNGKDKDQIDS